MLFRSKVDLAPADSATQEGLNGLIQDIGYTGNALSFGVQFGEQTLRAELATMNTRIPLRGDAACLSWKPEDAHLLPEEL